MVKGQSSEPRGSEKRNPAPQGAPDRLPPRRIKPGVKKAWFARNGQRSRAQVHAAVAAEGGMAFEAEETGSQCSNESDLSMDDAFYKQLEEKDLVPLNPPQEEDPPQAEEPPHQEDVFDGDPYCPDYQDTPPLRADSHGSIATTQPNGKQMAYLLECCKAQVVNPYTGKTVETTAFFDSGSNYSFVNEQLANELALPNQGPADLAVTASVVATRYQCEAMKGKSESGPLMVARSC